MSHFGGRTAAVRPPHRLADGQGKYAGADFLEAPTGHVIAAIVEVASVESPVHVDDVASRVAGMWGIARVGSRIAVKVSDALTLASRSGAVAKRGDFVWSASTASAGEAPVRSRTGMRVQPERIAPEEIEGAITLVLNAAGGMTRNELLSEVRQSLGVGRTIAQAFDDALASLTRAGHVGEGSVGYALRGQ